MSTRHVGTDRQLGVTRVLTDRLARVKFEDLPASVVKTAKRLIMDGLGVALAGSVQPTGRIIRDYAALEAQTGEVTLIGDARRCSPALSALANATMAHALDFDDVQWSMMGHPTAVIMPATLALAEVLNRSGRDWIVSYVAGVETAAKIGAGVNLPHYELGWHATGTLGTLGATVGASRIMDLGPDLMRMALGIAASRAGGVRQNFGTDTKPLHAGGAALNGVLSARLARLGFTADPDILEAPWGFFKLFSGNYHNPDAIVGRLGDPWSLVDPGVLVKPYASCISTHTAIDSILALIREHDVRPEQVERIEVGVVGLTQRILIHTRPQTGLEGKFSMQYCMARALLSRNLGISQFTDANVKEPAAQEWLRRVDWHVDPELEAAWKGGPRPAIVHLHRRDGSKLARRTDLSKGNPEVPMSDEELIQKFRDCAELALSADRVGRLLDRLLRLEEVASVREVAELLAPTAPADGRSPS